MRPPSPSSSSHERPSASIDSKEEEAEATPILLHPGIEPLILKFDTCGGSGGVSQSIDLVAASSGLPPFVPAGCEEIGAGPEYWGEVSQPFAHWTLNDLHSFPFQRFPMELPRPALSNSPKDTSTAPTIAHIPLEADSPETTAAGATPTASTACKTTAAKAKSMKPPTSKPSPTAVQKQKANHAQFVPLSPPPQFGACGRSSSLPYTFKFCECDGCLSGSPCPQPHGDPMQPPAPPHPGAAPTGTPPMFHFPAPAGGGIPFPQNAPNQNHQNLHWDSSGGATGNLQTRVTTEIAGLLAKFDMPMPTQQPPPAATGETASTSAPAGGGGSASSDASPEAASEKANETAGGNQKQQPSNVDYNALAAADLFAADLGRLTHSCNCENPPLHTEVADGMGVSSSDQQQDIAAAPASGAGADGTTCSRCLCHGNGVVHSHPPPDPLATLHHDSGNKPLLYLDHLELKPPGIDADGGDGGKGGDVSDSTSASSGASGGACSVVSPGLSTSTVSSLETPTTLENTYPSAAEEMRLYGGPLTTSQFCWTPPLQSVLPSGMDSSGYLTHPVVDQRNASCFYDELSFQSLGESMTSSFGSAVDATLFSPLLGAAGGWPRHEEPPPLLEDEELVSEWKRGNLRRGPMQRKPFLQHQKYFRETAKDILRDWLIQHMNYPYPDKQDKDELCQKTGLSLKQLNNWFTNTRKRHWRKSRVDPSVLPYPNYKRFRADASGGGFQMHHIHPSASATAQLPHVPVMHTGHQLYVAAADFGAES